VDRDDAVFFGKLLVLDLPTLLGDINREDAPPIVLEEEGPPLLVVFLAAKLLVFVFGVLVVFFCCFEVEAGFGETLDKNRGDGEVFGVDDESLALEEDRGADETLGVNDEDFGVGVVVEEVFAVDDGLGVELFDFPFLTEAGVVGAGACVSSSSSSGS